MKKESVYYEIGVGKWFGRIGFHGDGWWELVWRKFWGLLFG